MSVRWNGFISFQFEAVVDAIFECWPLALLHPRSGWLFNFGVMSVMRTLTFEKFEGTEEFRKNMKSGKKGHSRNCAVHRNFDFSHYPEKTGTLQSFRVHRGVPEKYEIWKK